MGKRKVFKAGAERSKLFPACRITPQIEDCLDFISDHCPVKCKSKADLLEYLVTYCYNGFAKLSAVDPPKQNKEKDLLNYPHKQLELPVEPTGLPTSHKKKPYGLNEHGVYTEPDTVTDYRRKNLHYCLKIAGQEFNWSFGYDYGIRGDSYAGSYPSTAFATYKSRERAIIAGCKMIIAQLDKHGKEWGVQDKDYTLVAQTLEAAEKEKKRILAGTPVSPLENMKLDYNHSYHTHDVPETKKFSWAEVYVKDRNDYLLGKVTYMQLNEKYLKEADQSDIDTKESRGSAVLTPTTESDAFAACVKHIKYYYRETKVTMDHIKKYIYKWQGGQSWDTIHVNFGNGKAHCTKVMNTEVDYTFSIIKLCRAAWPKLYNKQSV